jgi:hypothetical protein
MTLLKPMSTRVRVWTRQAVIIGTIAGHRYTIQHRLHLHHRIKRKSTRPQGRKLVYEPPAPPQRNINPETWPSREDRALRYPKSLYALLWHRPAEGGAGDGLQFDSRAMRKTKCARERGDGSASRAA